MVDATRYGFRIRACRNKRGWTQAELALRLGSVTRSAVAQWERGWTEPSKVNIQTLARVFNIPIAEMLPDFDRGVGSTAASGCRVATTSRSHRRGSKARYCGKRLSWELTSRPNCRRTFVRLIRLKRGDRWLEENRAALGEANAIPRPARVFGVTESVCSDAVRRSHQSRRCRGLHALSVGRAGQPHLRSRNPDRRATGPRCFVWTARRSSCIRCSSSRARKSSWPRIFWRRFVAVPSVRRVASLVDQRAVIIGAIDVLSSVV